MKYVYFMSFYSTETTGNFDMAFSCPINHMSDIRETEKWLNETHGTESAVITNFILLRTEE